MNHETAEIAEKLFRTLTPKQQQTLELLADGWTSKEIACQLDISESAVVQRIETLRMKAGGLLRKDLARLYRDHADQPQAPCKQIIGKNFHLPEWNDPAQPLSGSHPEAELILSDAMPFKQAAPWAMLEEPKVVPEVLDGANFAINRWLAACLLAIGMVVLMLVLLAVAGELSRLI